MAGGHSGRAAERQERAAPRSRSAGCTRPAAAAPPVLPRVATGTAHPRPPSELQKRSRTPGAAPRGGRAAARPAPEPAVLQRMGTPRAGALRGAPPPAAPRAAVDGSAHLPGTPGERRQEAVATPASADNAPSPAPPPPAPAPPPGAAWPPPAPLAALAACGGAQRGGGGVRRAAQPAAYCHSFRADVRCACLVGGTVWVAERGGVLRTRDAASGAASPPAPRQPGAPEEGSEVLRRTGLLVHALLPVGGAVWAACGDGLLRVFDTADHSVLAELGRHSGGALCLCIGQGGFVYSGGADRKVMRWNPDSLQQSGALCGHSGAVRALAAAPVGALNLFSAGEDAVVRCWRDAGRGEGVQLRGHVGAVLALLYDPDTLRLWSAGEDRAVRVWDVGAGSPVATLEGHGAAVAGLLRPAAGQVWSAAKDGSIVIWDARAHCRLQQVAERGEARLVCLASAGAVAGERVWSSDADGCVRCWLGAAPAAAQGAPGPEPPSGELQRCREELDDLGASVGSLRAQLEAKESDHFRQVERALELQGELEALRRRESALAADLRQARAEAGRTQEAEAALAAAREEAAARAAEAEALRGQVGELRALRSEAAAQEDMSSLLQRAARLRGGDDGELQRLRDEVSVLRGDIAVRDGNLHDARARLDEALRQLAQLRRTTTDQREELLRLETQAAEARRGQGDAERACDRERAAKEELARLYDAQEQSFQERLGRLNSDHRESQRERGAAEQDREALRVEVRRLGELLTEVSARAKEYQVQNAVLQERLSRELTADKQELEQRAREALREADAQRLSLQRAQAELRQLQEELAATRRSAQVADQARVAQLRAEWAAEREQLQQRIQALEREPGQGSKRDDWETPQQRKLKEALRETQQALEDIEARCGERTDRAEEQLREKTAALEKAEAEVRRLRVLIGGEHIAEAEGDARQVLYSQLQHDVVVKQELERQNVALESTVQQVKQQLVAMSSANRKLQQENDSLRSSVRLLQGELGAAGRGTGRGAGASAAEVRAPSQRGEKAEAALEEQPVQPLVPAPATEPCAVTRPPQLSANGSSASWAASSPARKTHTIDKMNRELDGLVDYIDGMKRKLEHLEKSAAATRDPYLREALLQEINALHRQVLDDSLAQGAAPRQVRGEKRLIPKGAELPPSVAGGILKLASQRFAAVEEELGITRPDPRSRQAPPSSSDADSAAAQHQRRSSQQELLSPPSSAAGEQGAAADPESRTTLIGGVRHQAPPPTVGTTQQLAAAPNVVRRAYEEASAEVAQAELFAP